MVGTKNYYKLWTLTDDVYMNLPNIIYTFDYFVPDAWARNKISKITKYGDAYLCADLYPGWAPVACPNGNGNVV